MSMWRIAILDGAVLPPPRGPLVLLLLTRLCRFGLLTMYFAVAEIQNANINGTVTKVGDVVVDGTNKYVAVGGERHCD